MLSPLSGSLSPLGPAQRVAAAGAGPFDPSTLAGLIFWLKADSITSGDGNPVATWPDSSTAANNATQSNGTLQPVYHAATLNGHAIVTFNGFNDELTVTPFDLTYATVIAACSMTAVGYEVCILGGAVNDGITFYTDGGLYWINTGASWVGIAPFAADPAGPGPWHVLTWRRSASVFDGWKDGSQSVGSPAPDATVTHVVDVGKRGGGPAANGSIAEVLVYNSALSDADRLAVETYLRTKYGI